MLGDYEIKKIDQSVVYEMISMMIIEQDLPFSFVEHRRFKELLQYLHPDVKVPSRCVATMNVNNLYEFEKKKMKCMLSKVPSRISLTFDVWTSCTSEEELKVIVPAVNKIRESIKYVKGLEGRMQVFKTCVAKVGGIHTKMGLRLDVITRWNSTFLMLESALIYQRAFCSLAFDDRSYSSCPTNEEWERGQKISSYSTSNLYFMQVWKIECLLLQNLSNEDELIRTMAIDMKTKFDKYWSDYNNVLSFGCILDSHCKIKLLKYCYSNLDPISCQAKLKVVEHELYILYNEYVQMYSKETRSNAGLSQDEDVSQMGKSQLDTYLEEANLSNKYHPNLDVLQYWKDNQAQFLDLSLLASDILSIEITTMTFESAFSIGSRVLNKY
ncbi:hypothetical protein JHK84_057176 [Glycine max]|nr:hypothetical protein JHK84_057176 [Glycine max]